MTGSKTMPRGQAGAGTDRQSHGQDSGMPCPGLRPPAVSDEHHGPHRRGLAKSPHEQPESRSWQDPALRRELCPRRRQPSLPFRCAQHALGKARPSLLFGQFALPGGVRMGGPRP